MLCNRCRYHLKRLETRRCPECGLAFHPNDASTFHSPKTISLRAKLIGVTIACVGLALAVGWLFELQRTPYISRYPNSRFFNPIEIASMRTLMGVLLTGSLLCVISIAAVIRRHRRESRACV
jgi:hypothetical protein